MSSDDPERDPMAPPAVPCECWCLHCRRVFMSSEMWFQRVINDPRGFEGFWMCPTPNCDGKGFAFDIYPTDPAHPANEGWDFTDDEYDEEEDEPGEWDPQETRYAEMDETWGDNEEDDDLEGEEWKYGLEPGERPPAPDWQEDVEREWKEEQRRYDEPDERPRVVDWSDREDRYDFSDDDIPF